LDGINACGISAHKPVIPENPDVSELSHWLNWSLWNFVWISLAFYGLNGQQSVEFIVRESGEIRVERKLGFAMKSGDRAEDTGLRSIQASLPPELDRDRL